MLPSSEEQVANKVQTLIDHGDEGIRPATPSIAVSKFLDDTWLFGKGLLAYVDVEREIRPDVKRWVDVDQLKTTCGINFPAERAVFQRRPGQACYHPI